MNDNGAAVAGRLDPFTQGMAAFRDALDREECPYPATHVEARSWLAGWEHGSFRAVDLAREEPPVVIRPERSWTDTETNVLCSLARDGETLSSLASRLRRKPNAVREQCERAGVSLTDQQLNS